jgi:hypothetical protein
MDVTGQFHAPAALFPGSEPPVTTGCLQSQYELVVKRKYDSNSMANGNRLPDCESTALSHESNRNQDFDENVSPVVSFTYLLLPFICTTSMRKSIVFWWVGLFGQHVYIFSLKMVKSEFSETSENLSFTIITQVR